MNENRRILRLAIPNIISNITIPLVGMAALIIVGRLGVDTMIGGLAIGTALFNFIYWNFAFLRMGTSGLVAQAYGGRDFREITAVLTRSLFVAVFAALILVSFRNLIGPLLFKMMNGSEETTGYAEAYFYARIWAAPATLSMFAFQGWFIGMQNSRFPMYISIIINIINVLLGVLFTLHLGMGIAGVAWATVVAQYTGLVISVLLWIKYYGRFSKYIDLRESINLKPLLKFFSVNRDIFLRTLFVVTVYTFFTSASSSMGDTLLAVNVLLMQLFTLYSYMMDGFAYAAESLIGRYVGARNAVMVQRYLKYLLFWSAGVAMFFTGIYAFLWRNILGLFTQSEAIITMTGDYIYWMLAVPLVSFIAFLVDGALVGATQTHIMRNNVFFSTAAFFVIYYSLRNVIGNDALWLAYVSFLTLRTVLLYFQTNRFRLTW